MTREEILKIQFSDKFIERMKEFIDVPDDFVIKMQNDVEQAYYTYGPTRENAVNGLIDMVGSAERNIRKFRKTGNQDYLVAVAVYSMIEFMFPQKERKMGQIEFPNFDLDEVQVIEQKLIPALQLGKNLGLTVTIACYAVHRFLNPRDGEFYRCTGSSESAGIDGMSIRELREGY